MSIAAVKKDNDHGREQAHIKINPIHLAAARFAEADNIWNEALRDQFGRSACNARYEKRGKGNPGSKLRDLYIIREYARQSWIREYARQSLESSL